MNYSLNGTLHSLLRVHRVNKCYNSRGEARVFGYLFRRVKMSKLPSAISTTTKTTNAERCKTYQEQYRATDNAQKKMKRAILKFENPEANKIRLEKQRTAKMIYRWKKK